MKYSYKNNDETSLFEVILYENGKPYDNKFVESVSDFDNESLEIGYYNIRPSKEHVFRFGSIFKKVGEKAGKVYEFNPKSSYTIQMFKFNKEGIIEEVTLYEHLSVESSVNDGGTERNVVKFKKA